MNTLLPLLLALVPFLGVDAQLQVCLNGGSGPCLNGACPVATERCINTTAGAICCAQDQISNQTITTRPVVFTTSGTSRMACVDLVNPRTGVSDCPRVSALCKNPVYDAVMTRQCPKTCGRCGMTAMPTMSTSPAVCQDRINPATGKSDCAARLSLCRDTRYMDLMREQCGKHVNIVETYHFFYS